MLMVKSFVKAWIVALALLFSANVYGYAPNSSWDIRKRPTSQDVMNAYNVIYPELNVVVAKPASEEVLLSELETLRNILHQAPYNNGQLVHLACCTPACGGGNTCN